MGCVSSTPAAVDENNVEKIKAKQEEQARQQRRRLSVAPEHVGDISKDKDAANKPADHKEEAPVVVAVPLPKSNDLKGHNLIQYAAFSKKGYVPYNRNKVNQDREAVHFGLQGDPSMALFAVMDGHGECGHEVAQFVKSNLCAYLEKQNNLKKDTTNAIMTAVKQLVDHLMTTTINIAFSGTTCVFAVLVEKTLYVANIGDSRCVLCKKKNNNDFEPVALSIDQKPELPEEKARIIKAGGRVEPLPGPPGEDCGPPRVWLADVDVPGLAMSRSIGDEVSQTVGVTSIPVVQVHEIGHDDLFFVIASDGVWEFIPNSDACKIIHDNLANLDVAAGKLVEEAHERWTREEEVVDDITCVIASFRNN